jgi:hypothetical protein
MRKLKIFILSLGLFSITHAMFSQDQPPKVLVMGVPQYLFINGLRIDMDVPSDNYRTWWVFAPQFYIKVSEPGGINNKNFKQLHGFGLSVYRKVFLSKDNYETGAYIMGGLGLQHFNILDDSEHWADFIENGLTYKRLVTDDYHIYINKILTEAVIGYQKDISSRLYVDFYAGIGLRYSFYDQPSGNEKKFNRNIFDYGYTGTAFVGGIRIGVGL